MIVATILLALLASMLAGAINAYAGFDITGAKTEEIILTPGADVIDTTVAGRDFTVAGFSPVTINEVKVNTEKEVTLNVKRYTTESSDCTLANIYSEDYPIDFSKNTYSYKLKLPKNVNNIDLEIVPSDEESATYQVEGNEKLKNNSKITIDVRAQDGTTCKYEITIKKSSNTWKYIVVIVLLLSVLVVASVVLYKYLKKSKGKYKYE